VGFREIAPLDEWDPHRREIPWACDLIDSPGRIRVLVPTVGTDRRERRAAAQWDVIDEGGRRDARNLERGDEPLLQRLVRRGIRESLLRRRDIDLDEVGGIEAGLDTREKRKALNEEPGARDQHDGERNLRGDDRAAELESPLRGAGAATARFERRHE